MADFGDRERVIAETTRLSKGIEILMYREGMDIQELSIRSDVPVETIDEILGATKFDISPVTLIALARALYTDTKDLLILAGFDEKPKNYKMFERVNYISRDEWMKQKKEKEGIKDGTSAKFILDELKKYLKSAENEYLELKMEFEEMGNEEKTYGYLCRFGTCRSILRKIAELEIISGDND